MFAHDAAHNQKSKTSAGRFGGEIRFEHAAQIFGRHPDARVREAYQHVGVVAICADAQDATAFHCFEAVLNHVIESLLHLVAVELEQRQIGTKFLLDDELAVLNFRSEKAHRFIDNRIHVFGMQLWL